MFYWYNSDLHRGYTVKNKTSSSKIDNQRNYFNQIFSQVVKMSIATPDLLNAIADLTRIREMKIAVNVTAQCGIITSLTTIAGGLVGGPPGIAVGGLIGTVLASYHANGKFKSVPEILATDATPEQKEKLADAIRNILTAENILTLVQFAAMIQNNKVLMDMIQKAVRDFLTSDMGYTCIS